MSKYELKEINEKIVDSLEPLGFRARADIRGVNDDGFSSPTFIFEVAISFNGDIIDLPEELEKSRQNQVEGLKEYYDWRNSWS